jgi:hypothetical protein
MNFIIGFVLGVIFSQLALKLFDIGWKKIEAKIDELKNK